MLFRKGGRVTFRTPQYIFLRRAAPPVTLLGVLLVVVSLYLRLPTVVGIGSSVLVGALAMSLALVKERGKCVVLVGGGLVLPLERPTSNPRKYRVFSEPVGQHLVTFDEISDIYPTLHDFSSGKPLVVPGLRILLQSRDGRGASLVGPLMATLPALPWLDLGALLRHLREGLGPRWPTVFHEAIPLTNLIRDFPKVWDSILADLRRADKEGPH